MPTDSPTRENVPIGMLHLSIDGSINREDVLVSGPLSKQEHQAMPPASESDNQATAAREVGIATHVWSRSDSSCFPCACSSAARL